MNWEFLENEILENKVHEIFLFIGILLFGLLFKRYGATIISKQAFRFFKQVSQNEFSEEFVALIRKPFEQLITLIILYIAFNRLVFPEAWNLEAHDTFGLRWFLFTGWMIAMFVTGTKVLLRATDFFSLALANRKESTVSFELANFLKELIKVVIVILCVFAGLRFVFHVNITALVASLGIGGLAVALAAQDTLANLLGSFIIYLDKPFKVGDQVEAGDIKGKVEHVGFRTTRIRTAEKSLLTVPNKKLIDTALNNITLSESRRVRVDLALSYSSKPEQITGIIADMKEVLMQQTMVSKDFVVRFSDIDRSSFNILIVYFVMSNEYDVMIAIKEAVNIQIMQLVEKHGCEFASATQTIQIHK